jgi:hypothetical protein
MLQDEVAVTQSCSSSVEHEGDAGWEVQQDAKSKGCFFWWRYIPSTDVQDVHPR